MMGAADDQEASGGEEKIYVSVRLRPLNGKEIARNDVSDWECINDTTIIYRNNLSVSERSMYPSAYTFDTVFGPERSTRQVYEEGAKNVALSVVSGINSSVFAYGQTSSGKTYTMSGITEYTVADIYDYIESHKEREFVLKFSAMEIYNESVRDLLSADATPLRLLDDPERGTVVERLTEETLRDWNHFKELLCICEAQRQIGETNLNETSSRSHQILRLTIESSAREFLGNDKSSTLAATVNFVDLAGSERASQSLSAGMRLKEGCHINRSLLTLGTVIRKLSKGRNGHIPFRDSKLTRILQSSLGGNARTAIICTMSPARIHVEQSRNTLLFASCAKEVTTNAQVNVVMSDKALVKQLQRELARLECELKSGGHHSVTTDTTLLKEKDLQIEKLMKEVVELNRRLDLAQSRVADLLRAAEDDRPSTVWEDADGQYPKLRVRNSCRSELSASYSSISEGPPSIDVGARSFDDSQCSDRRSSSSSDDKFVQLDLNEFFQTNFSPEPSIRTNDPGEKIAKEQANGDLDSIYEEVLCIKVKSSTHRYADSSVSQTSQNRHSNMSSPNQKTGTSGLTEVRNEEKANQELASPLLNERKDSNDPNAFFIMPSPEKTSPWVLEQGICSSGSLKLIRSRSCKARLMSNSPGYWFEKVEKKESTPLVGFEKDTPFFRLEKTTSLTGFKKDFIGRPEDCQRKPSCLKYGPEVETLSRNGSRTSVTSSAVDDLKGKGVDSFTDWKAADVINSEAGTMYLGDKSVDGQSSRSTAPEKSVKDVGLDPIQDDAENAPQWPSEFKRLQMQIIELWHACNVSLVHRTYFFLLFKGDPSDSFYMDVELRKLSFLKDTFSRDKATMADGRILTLSSSERALSQERQMLSKEMQRRLSREERENLFLRWEIPLNSNNRRLQLAHRLWTKTADLDHLAESAALVAKLVGFAEEGVASKETFGLLNLTPIYPSRRRISLWKRSVFSLL